MEPREIKDLLRFVRNAGFHEFELRMEGFRLRVVKDRPLVESLPGSASGAALVAPAPALPAGSVNGAAEPVRAADSGAASEEDGLHQVTAPMVGTFYRAPNPDAEPFVNVGDRVQPGQTLCIIEAMKLMNEIEAETAGTVVEILARNAQPVEFGEAIFRLHPE